MVEKDHSRDEEKLDRSQCFSEFARSALGIIVPSLHFRKGEDTSIRRISKSNVSNAFIFDGSMGIPSDAMKEWLGTIQILDITLQNAA
jgi:hypothetical protein